MKLLPVLFAVLFVNACFAQNDSSRTWTSIHRTHYTIDFPSDMILDTTMEMGTDLFMNTYQENPADSFSENIVVAIQNLDEEEEGVTPGIYTAMQEDLLYEMYKEFTIEESTILNNASGQFHKWIYSGINENNRLKWEQYTFIAHKKAFVVTLTTKAETFEKYKELGEKILNSFSLKR